MSRRGRAQSRRIALPALLIASLAFVPVGLQAEQPLLLVTEAELAASLAAPEPLFPRFTPEPGAPRILVETPRLNAAISAPIALRLRFEASRNTKIRPETFKVKYGSLRIDITERITGATEVSPSGLEISRASLPKGRHTLVFSIEDALGRLNERPLQFEIL